MRFAVGMLASLSLVGITSAFATEPTPPSATPQAQQPAQSNSTTPAPDATPPASAAPAASVSAPPTTATTQPAAAPAQKSKELTPEEKNLISSGYTLEVRKDQKYFCRREAALGTRFARKTCQSEEQILANTQDSKDLTRQFQNPTQYPQGITRQ